MTNEIRGQRFTLVDSSDYAVGTFTAEPVSAQGPKYPPLAKASHPPMRIVLRDSRGREIWSAGGGLKATPASTEPQ